MHHYFDPVYSATSGARVGNAEATGAQPFVMVDGATSQYNNWLGNAFGVDRNSTGSHWYQSNRISNAGSMHSDKPAYQNTLYDGASEAYSSASTSLFTPDFSIPRTSGACAFPYRTLQVVLQTNSALQVRWKEHIRDTSSVALLRPRRRMETFHVLGQDILTRIFFYLQAHTRMKVSCNGIKTCRPPDEWLHAVEGL